VAAVKAAAVDTTAAGDTFIGYFLAERAMGKRVRAAMEFAAKAAALCVTRRGAAESIPSREEVEGMKPEALKG
jgi:ribokinase